MARFLSARDLKPDVASGQLSKRQVRNDSGVDIAEGEVVVVTGVYQNLYLAVEKADADSTTTLEGTLFIADMPIKNGTFGTAVAWKLLTGVNTSGASLNDPVYVSSTAGGWSLSGGGTSRRIGSVVTVDASDGVVLLAPGDEVPSEGRISTVAGGGTLDELADVSVASPSDQDVLTWDDGTSTWVAQAAGGVSGDVATSIELTRTTAVSTGANSIVIGNGASGNLSDQVSIGNQAGTRDNNSSPTYGVAIGFRARWVVGAAFQNSGAQSTLVGYQAEGRTDARYGVALGQNTSCRANSSIAIGSSAITYRTLSVQLAQTAGKQVTTRSLRFRQHHVAEMRASTTTATPTEATADGNAASTADDASRNVVVLNDGKIAGFALRMTAIQTTTNDAAYYEIAGAAKCISGTASIIGANTTIAKEDDAGWDCTVTCTGNRLVVTCTADADGTTTWSGMMTLTYED